MNITSITPEYAGKFRRLILSGFILIILATTVDGQKTEMEKPPLKERFFYGGSLGLQFGTQTNIEILPVVGFWVLPRVAVAAGPGFRFFSYMKQKTTIYSARGYVQLVVIRDINKMVPVGVHTSIILQLEDEGLSLDSQYWHNVDREPDRFWVNSVLAGPGISQQVGRRSSLNILFLWTLNSTGYEIYSNPVIRIGFVF
jgi:hypothetical protein